MREIVMIGGGMAGLGAAWELEHKRKDQPLSYRVLESESRIGGLCRTESVGDFLFDYTGHLLHFRSDYFKKIVLDLIGTTLETRQRSAWIYSHNTFTRYPFQANLYGLPIDVVVECLYEYSRAHFDKGTKNIKSFEDWVVCHFGEGIARHFMIPYNSKIYRRKPKDLSPDCGGRFVPQSDLRLLLKGALSSFPSDLGYNAVFHYPATGGIETLVHALAKHVKYAYVSERVEKIRLREKRVITASGKALHYDVLIPSLPLPELIRRIEDIDDETRAAAMVLSHVSVLNINFGVRGNISDKHWVYVPEEHYLFHRIGFPHNFSSGMAPAGHSSIYIEISYDPHRMIDVEMVREQTITDLVRMGILHSRDQIVVEKILDLPYGYVIFDHYRSAALEKIKNSLSRHSIFPAGRFGEWDYHSMEDSFLSGRDAALKALALSFDQHSSQPSTLAEEAADKP